MPSPDECSNIKITQAETNARVNAIAERLDEVLEEVKDFKQWLQRYGTACFFIILLGDKAIPIVTKMLGVTV